jgi:hypothetical protein
VVLCLIQYGIDFKIVRACYSGTAEKTGLFSTADCWLSREDAIPNSSVVQVSRSLGSEIVLVPIRILPAVRHLLTQYEHEGTSKSFAKLVGNDPEDADDEG